MLIDIAPIFVRLIVAALLGHVSERTKSRLEVYDSVKDTAKPAFYAGGAYASWVVVFGGVFGLYDGSEEGRSRAGYTVRVSRFFCVMNVDLELIKE